MKIIRAVQYENRTVIRVCHNPDQLEWVHVVGDQMLSGEGAFRFLPDGQPDLVTSTLPPPGHTGETCHNCRYNWDVSEIIFDGPDLFYPGPDGDLVRFTDHELAEAAFTRATKPSEPLVLGMVEGLEG